MILIGRFQIKKRHQWRHNIVYCFFRFSIYPFYFLGVSPLLFRAFPTSLSLRFHFHVWIPHWGISYAHTLVQNSGLVKLSSNRMWALAAISFFSNLFSPPSYCCTISNYENYKKKFLYRKSKKNEMSVLWHWRPL